MARSIAGAVVALGAMLGAGCQTQVSVDTNTRIEPLPPMARSQPQVYVQDVVLTGPSAEVDAGRDETDPITHQKQPSFGKAVYLKSCQGCHGATGKAAMPGVPDLSDPVYSWTRTPQEYFRDLLASPAHQRVARDVDRQDLWNAVYYAWTLHSSLNDVVQGGFLFGRYCSVCHGTKGRGDGNLAEGLNPRPRRFVEFPWMVDKTDQRLYISISDGRAPSAMPAWKAALSPTQRIQILNYVRQFSYHYPEDIPKRMAEQPTAD